MKYIVTNLKRLYIVASILLLLVVNTICNAQSWSQYYSTQPDAANCKAGVLTNAVKTDIIDYINFIRSLHGIKPASYAFVDDNLTAQAALIIVANKGNLDHTPPSTVSCYSQDGYNGSSTSNLYGGSGGGSSTCRDAIVSWMHDDNSLNAQDRVGHRRAIINPFVETFSFGRCDGTIQGSSYIGESLKWMNTNEYDLTNWGQEFIAFPFHDYPPELVVNGFYFNFSVFPNKTWSYGNDNAQGKIDYTNTTVSMTDDQNATVATNSTGYDYEGWGGIQNSFRWKAVGVVSNKVYTVNIKNVVINGVSKDYTYWFSLNGKTAAAPDVPAIIYPSNNAQDVLPGGTNISWSIAPRASYYLLKLSKNAGCAAPYLVNETRLSVVDYLSPALELNTQYYWQVAAVNSYGQSAWSQVFTFKTNNLVQPVPTLSSPANGADASMAPNLTWGATSNTKSYWVQVSTDKNNWNSSTIVAENVNNGGQSFQISDTVLKEKTTYYWRVKSNGDYGLSDWSAIWSFKTTVTAPVDAPILSSPTNGTNTSNTPTFLWSAITGATSYWMQISTDPDIWDSQTVVFDQKNIANNTYTIAAGKVAGGKWNYWHIKALNTGGESAWSQYSRFKPQGTSVQDDLNYQMNEVQIYPNPIEDRATIIINSASNEKITLKLYNSFGQEILTLIDNQEISANYKIDFKTNDLTSGIYYYQLKGATNNATGIIEIIK